MTEPYLEILNKGKTLRVNTSCPFKAMDGSDTPVYLPNPVDIDAGLIQDNMSTIPLDPEYKTTLRVSFPQYGTVSTRIPMMWQKEAKVTNIYNTWINDIDNWYNKDISQKIGEEYWAYFAQWHTANLRLITPLSLNTSGGVLMFPYWFEAGKEYRITAAGQNVGNITETVDGAEFTIYTPDDKEVYKLPVAMTGRGENTFIAPRTGFYNVKLKYPYGTNFGLMTNIDMLIQDLSTYTNEELNPWGQIQYVKGMGSYDSKTGSGSFRLEINNTPFDESMYSNIGYIYLYPQNFDHFIQYGEEIQNENN